MTKIEKKKLQNWFKIGQNDVLARKSLFEPSLDFKPHLLNPFNTEHKEKTAVPFSILRVVMWFS